MQDDPLIGSTLGHYQVVEVIGRGGMATVYKAYHPALDRHVAVKVLPAYFAHDPDFSERFRREARAVARLEHPNILPVYDFGEQDHVSYIVMSLVAGGTLKDRVGSPLPLAWSLRICEQIAQALDYAHENGIVHRDVKPSNILLGPGDRPLLADFGIAKLADASRVLTRSGLGVGTPEYLSPEQAQGHVLDGRSDLYSLAMMLFEMLAGEVPFQGDSAFVVVFKHLNEPVPSVRVFNPNVPPAIDMIMRRALAKRQEERFDTAGEFVEALLRVGQSRDPHSGPDSRPPEMTPRPLAGKSLPAAKTGAPTGEMPNDMLSTSNQPTMAVASELAEPRTASHPSRLLVVGTMVGVALLLGLIALSRNVLTEASTASTPTALLGENPAELSSAATATSEAQEASADATRVAAQAEATATAEAATTALAGLIQATVQAEIGVVLEATAQVQAAAGTATAQAVSANPTSAPVPTRAPTAIRRPTSPPPPATSAPPTSVPATVREPQRLAPRIVVQIAGADCRGVNGSVGVNTATGVQPLRDYVVKGALTMPDGTQRVVWEDLAVPGPRFQLEFPARLPPRGSYEIALQVTKTGAGSSALTRQTFTCT